MSKHLVAITKYRKKIKSVKKVIEQADVFKNLSGNENVFIKPNIVTWAVVPNYPKFGVITTSRVVEDTIIALKERGINNITIGEGIITLDPKDTETARHAFEYLGYNKFKKRYGIKVINTFERPFEKVDLGAGIELNFNADALHSDFVVSIPVLKTHAQTKVSLGLKNLKGLIDVNSRKICHSADLEKDLDFHVSKLSNKLPPTAVVIDGIFKNERGPSHDGRMKRSNILVASSDMFSADKVGAQILGYEPSEIPYFVYYAKEHNRTLDLSDVEVVGTKIENVAEKLEYKFPYTEDGSIPLVFKKRGIKGISYREYDNSLCTYCSGTTGPMLTAIAFAWEGEPWDDVEVILGKRMEPTPGKKKTILFGQCMVNKHRNNPVINEMIPIKGCPAKPENVLNALHKAGINVSPELIENLERLPSLGGIRYRNRFNEFEELFFNEDIKTETVPPLENIVVSQIYVDNNAYMTNMAKKQAKFEVMFLGLFGEKFTKSVKNIIIEGPNNYEFEIKNQPFDFKNGNGYTINRLNFDQVRYIGFDQNGFLEDGEYTLTVEYYNDEKRHLSRVLKYNDRLLNAYLENRDKIAYIPQGEIENIEDLDKPFRTKWTTLNKLANFNAYYTNRVSEGSTDYIDFHNLYFYDDISLLSMVMPSYGLNKESAWINNFRWKLRHNTDYTWFTEICDSNKYEEVNVSIYQPHQHFKIL